MANKRISPKKAPRRTEKVSRPKSEGFISSHIKQAKYALANLFTRPFGSLLTITVIAMSLALPSTFYMFAKNVNAAAKDMGATPQISIYINEKTFESRVVVLKDQLETWPEISKISYVSPQDGLEELSEFAGLDEVLSLLDSKVLPPVLIVQPKDSLSPEATEQLISRLRTQDQVTDIRMDKDWSSRLDAISNLVSVVVILFVVLMFVAVLLMIGNTLRFNILAHKDEIQIMKLIGATDRYILKPYLYSGFWLGIIGASGAWVLTLIIQLFVSNSVDTLAGLYDSHFTLNGLSVDETILLLMIGTSLGWLSANFSARKHLKEIEPV